MECRSNLKKLKFLVFISGSFFISFNSHAGLFDLEETPLGTYKRCGRPNITELPPATYLEMTPAKDQGVLGTCVSFTTSACGEYYHQGMRFSEAEFTVLAETHVEPKKGGDCIPGINLGAALGVGRKYGLIPENQLPYPDFERYVAKKNGIDPSRPDWRSSLAKKKKPSVCTLRRDAKSQDTSYNLTMREMGVPLGLNGTQTDIGYQLPPIYPIHHVSRTCLIDRTSYSKLCIGEPGQADTEWVEFALSNSHPVAVALPIFSRTIRGQSVKNWDNEQLLRERGRSPQIPLPSPSSTIAGYHAVVLTGFSYEKKMFRVKNSWGMGWGSNGYADIPYAYIREHATELVGIGEK